MIYYILILFLSISFSQNFTYNNEDWFTISNPGLITSITVANDEIIFSSENGMYSYNKYSSDLIYLEEFVRSFDSNDFYMIHYDLYRDYLWLLNKDNLYYRPYTSSYWREIDFDDIDLNGHMNILNIGSNVDYFFINIGSEIIVLNPFTGQLITEINNDIYYANINWSNTYRNLLDQKIDLTGYYSFEGYNFITNNQI